MSQRALPILSLVTLLLALLWSPALAIACPACAGRNDGGPGLFFVYAAMVFSPFLATYVVFRVVKHMTSRDAI